MPVAPLIAVSLFFLVVEGIIIVLQVKSSALYRIRFIIIWFFVTLTTWMGLYAWLRFMPGLFRAIDLLPNDVLLVLSGECLVVLIEGLVLWRLLQWRFVARNTTSHPSLRRAMGLSLAVNVVSLGGSILTYAFLLPLALNVFSNLFGNIVD
jgi:uncharacterized protein YjeT (DUF2065 family)